MSTKVTLIKGTIFHKRMRQARCFLIEGNKQKGGKNEVKNCSQFC